jgi:hypothetical protein
MSGPKVVRIVTLEEIREICRSHIGQVDAAIARVLAALKRHDMARDEKTADLERQRAILMASFEAGKFMEVQKLALALVDFCNSEVSRVEDKATQAAEAARHRGRRLADAARGIIALRERQNLPVGPELRSIVSRAVNADPNALDKMQAMLDDALREAARAGSPTELSKGAQELAGRLAAGAIPTSLTDWLTKNPAPVDEKERRLDKALAELKVIGEVGLFDTFAARAADIAMESSPDRRALLTDSLMLDASKAVAKEREMVKLRVRSEELAADLASLPNQGELIDRLKSAFSGRDEATMRTSVSEAESAVADARSELAAKARRQAVLKGLATLGYEVREGMATAWAEGGRIVLRKPNETDYGLELGAASDLSRLQVQLVGSDQPSAPRDKARDRDREVSWCSDFDRLRASVAAAGGELVIERALAAGAQAVKTVPASRLAPDIAVGVEGGEHPKTRTL